MKFLIILVLAIFACASTTEQINPELGPGLKKVERKPILLHFVRPVYPSEAIGLTGKVLVKFLVDKKGSVRMAHVVRGPKIFHQSAIDAVSQWRFIPARSDKGEVVSVWMVQPVNFGS